MEKFAFEDEGTIQYQVVVPKLEQFTLCAWLRFTNHDGDHSMFTYSGKDFFFSLLLLCIGIIDDSSFLTNKSYFTEDQ